MEVETTLSDNMSLQSREHELKQLTILFIPIINNRGEQPNEQLLAIPKNHR